MEGADSMDVYLLPRPDGRYFLYAPGVLSEASEKGGGGDSLGRRLLTTARDAYSWATRSRRRKERLLKTLGELEKEPIRIHYPSSTSAENARRVYRELVEEEIRKHRKWMIASTAALPASVPLSLIPGPNVLLGYLAWRSVVHYRSKKAGERAAAIELDFVPDTTLSELETVVREQTRFRRRERIRKLGERLGLEQLDEAY